MKKFNLNLITPLILTLILQGCMPDSMTKFKKEAPKKVASAPVAPPIVDSSGDIIPFTQPSYMLYGADSTSLFNLTVGTSSKIKLSIDGTLSEEIAASEVVVADPTAVATPALPLPKFIKSCVLVTTGNSQTRTLPSGLKLSTKDCSIEGKPTINKSIVTEFCSTSSIATKTLCESTPLVWDSGTETCSNPDFQYSSQESCESSFNTWYTSGTAVPYRVELTFTDSSGILYGAYATALIGAYTPIGSLKYTQSEKLLLPVTTTPTVYSAIVPARTTAASTDSYLGSNIISFQNGTTGVASFVDETQNILGIRKISKLILSSGAGFDEGDIISSGTPGNTTKQGKIFKKDTSSTNIIYIENISNGEAYFVRGDSLDYVANYGAQRATISSIEEYTVDLATPNADNEVLYYSPKIVLKDLPINSYIVNENIKKLTPTVAVATNNGISFSISPKLPDGLTLSTTSGEITGKFVKPLTPTLHTVTAKNPLGTSTHAIWLTSSAAPTDLSLSTKQIITVSTTAFFTEGETLFQPVIPPLAEAPTAKILKILNGNQLAIESNDGTFLAGASLDSGSNFFSEKAYIVPDKSCIIFSKKTQEACELASSIWSTGPVYYNLSLKLAPPSSTYQVGTCSASPLVHLTQATCEANSGVWGPTYITSSSGARGTLAGILKDNVNGDTLFVRHITEDAAGILSQLTFKQDGAETVTDPNSNIKLITEVDNSFVKLTLSNAATFSVGQDVTSTTLTTGTVVQAGGYIYSKSSNDIFVSDITRAPGATSFRRTYFISPNEFAAASAITINTVTHDDLFVTERGKKTHITPSLSAGSAFFGVTPNLPAGLAMDTKTGQITGTPTILTPRKEYTMTATNFLGQATYTFSLEVRDYFTISENSGAPSFLMHKMGDTQVNRKCRISANEINSLSGVLDVKCNLEGEEEDIYFKSIKFQAHVGPGICQYIQYAPYYFWQYAPTKTSDPATPLDSTDAEPTGITIRAGFCNVGIPPISEDVCDGNYTKKIKDGPNCDEGKFSYQVKATIDGGTLGCVDDAAPAETVTVDCGGKKTACLNGPLKNLLTDDHIDNGSRSVIYQSVNGLAQEWALSSPIEKGSKGNMRVANSSAANMCTSSTADFNTWTAMSTAKPSTTSPFGETSPYYVFNCLDAASQIKARIRVVVREWDKTFKINSGIDLDSPAGGLMNAIGADIYQFPFNNHSDWDDDYASKGSCNITDYTTEYHCNAYGGTWYSKGANYARGSCDDPIYTTQASCESHSPKWTIATGTCSDGAYTTQATCLAGTPITTAIWSNPGTQGSCGIKASTSGREYEFPKNKL